MSNGLFAQSLIDWKAAAVAVFAAQSPALPASQVAIGRLEFQPDDNFYEDLAENGFYLVLEMPEGQVNTESMNGRFDVTAELFYPIPADVANDMSGPNNMIAALIQGWATNFDLWTQGGNRNPLEIKWEKPKPRFHEKPNIYSIKFVLSQPIAPVDKVYVGYTFKPAVS